MAATPWTSLPPHFRRPNGTSEHSTNQKRGAPLDSFLEGPCYVTELNTLFLTNIPYGRVSAVDIATKEWTLGILALPLPIEKIQDGIQTFPPPKDRIETLVSRYRGERLKDPNDLVISSKTGHIYFTDQGMPDLPNPNGRVSDWTRMQCGGIPTGHP
ncbi:hypothetical protein BDW69DRAFT_189919 [Aspergillus filifer]